MKLEFETKEEGNAFWEWLIANKKRPDVMEASVVETHKIFIREYRKGEIKMQTFLPYSDFKKSVECLDNKRLNRQIMEAKIIYDIVHENRTSGGWVNHPAVKMWRCCPEAIALYLNACLDEWERRGRSHSYQKIPITEEANVKMPFWLGDERLHSSHRSNLLRKDAFYYEKFGWTEGPGEPYFWPI